MGIKVAKFGGSSLSDAAHFRKVKEIIEGDPDYCYVVPSAPGKRFDGDTKITDLLYQCYRLVERNRSHEEVFRQVVERYLEIAHELDIVFDADFDFIGLLNETGDAVEALANALEDYASIQAKIHRLSKYYGSDQWYDDRAVDDAGKLPADLKRGVLTEDLVFDVLTGNRDNALRMLEIATQILKSH